MIEFLVAFIKAIPLLHDVFVRVVELYYLSLDMKDEQQTNANAMKRREILDELKRKDLTDERRNELRKALYLTTRN